MDVDSRLAAVAMVRAVVGATDTDPPVSERVMARDGLGALLDGLSHAESERVALQLASFVWAISDVVGFPLEYLLAGLRAEAVEQAAGVSR